MSHPGTDENPLLVAVVGSGPSGFYATEALLRSEHKIKINMFERLPNPFGLVRSGVAPDHAKLKQAIQVYTKIADAPEFNFIGNVTIGRDLSVEELTRTHHAVIFTCGAETDRKLGSPGKSCQAAIRQQSSSAGITATPTTATGNLTSPTRPL